MEVILILRYSDGQEERNTMAVLHAIYFSAKGATKACAECRLPKTKWCVNTLSVNPGNSMLCKNMEDKISEKIDKHAFDVIYYSKKEKIF